MRTILLPVSSLHPLQEPALNETNLSKLKAPLDIPVPDPVKEKEKEERKKQQEASWAELGGGGQPPRKAASGLIPLSPPSLCRRKTRMARRKGTMKTKVP